MKTLGWIDELRLAARSLARRPGYAFVAIATLALGVGASVAIFAVVNSVLLRPLPYPSSERIVMVNHHAPGLNLPELSSSEGMIEFYRDAAKTITRMAAVSNPSVNLTGNGPAERIEVERVTPEFFDVVATYPARGRAFAAQDVVEGAAGVVILTHASWQSRFGGDASILGRRIEIDGQQTEIIGVMPKGFAFPDPSVQALLPLYMSAAKPFGAFGLVGLARLAPGATLESARAELVSLQARLPDRFQGQATADFLKRAGWNATLVTLHERNVRDIRATLWILLGGVGLLLLIATANVANLFLVRAESRQREMALRAALGASRWRMAATFLAESGVVGVAGGVLGLIIAWAGVRLLVANGPEQLPRLYEVQINGTVFAFAAIITIAASAVLGLMPFAALRRRSSAASLREGGRSATVGRERHRVRKLLIATQVAMSLVLLVGAQLMLSSVRHLKNVDPGFRANDALTVGVSLDRQTQMNVAAQFYQQVANEASQLPGVQFAGVTNSLPVERTGINGSSFSIESRPRPDDALPPVAYYSAVTQGYFDAIGIPLREGRAPEWRDSEGRPRVIWVNETFVKQFLGGRAIGERIRFGDDSTWSEIVGVVGDVRHAGLREKIQPMAFYPLGVRANGVEVSRSTLVVRTTSDAAQVGAAVRGIVSRANASVPIVAIRTMNEVIASSVAQTAFTMTLLTIAALVALALGVVGLYGVISYVVGQRSNEFGVRMALGARPGQIRTMVVRQGVFVALGGIAVGLAAAVGLTRLMETILFEVSARDPLIFAGSAVVLMLISAIASDLPARRAAAVEPVAALRAE
ncbi:MAG TPA: ABC transporter permease [Gemmatimonadaceae bacterium]|nr:ABC transporter permease [Gemmatimonadaceae bacterium]